MENKGKKADVVVVGSGTAGLTAAIAAADSGQKVILVEASDVLGGTTSKSGAIYWIPNNRFMQNTGRTDSLSDALRYMARLSFPAKYSLHKPYLGLSAEQYELLEVYYREASRTVEALEKMDALHSTEAISVGDNPLGYPDYHSHLKEDQAPYGRHLQPKASDGSAGGGPEMISQLSTAAHRMGVQIFTGHRAVNLLRRSDGEIVGIEARAGNEVIRIEARRGVIFGSGGFTHSPDLALEFLRGPIFGGGAVPTNRGDFFRMANSIGAELGNMSMAWFAEVPLELALREPSQPNNVWMPYGDSMFIVNRHGKRVQNEKLIYHDRTMVHFHWDGNRCEYPNLFLFMIYDDSVAKDTREWPMRWPVPMPSENLDYVISGNTFKELEHAISERLTSLRESTGVIELGSTFLSNLKETLSRFNSFAKSGRDEEFARGERQIEIDWSGRAREGNKFNPTMFPLSTSGPYYCIILAPGTLDTCGGPKTDREGRILSNGDVPIPGLFGAGNCVASISGQAYWSGGSTIGLALTFGFLAGRAAAVSPSRETSSG